MKTMLTALFFWESDAGNMNDGGSWGVVNEKLASILSVTDSSVLGREKIPFISDTTRTMVSHTG